MWSYGKNKSDDNGQKERGGNNRRRLSSSKSGNVNDGMCHENTTIIKKAD